MGIYLKFGSEKNILDLLKNGTIYCKEISYFASKQIKNTTDGRWDFNELVTKMEFTANGFMKLHPIDHPDKIYSFKTENIMYKEHMSNPLGNLYCMFDLEPKKIKQDHWFELDRRLTRFGSHYLLIHNSPEFANRVKNKLKELSIEFKFAKVEYKDFSKYIGDKTIFQKDLKYSYQNEVRLVLNTNMKTSFKFSIGNIEDISTMFTSDHLKIYNGGKLNDMYQIKFGK